MTNLSCPDNCQPLHLEMHLLTSLEEVCSLGGISRLWFLLHCIYNYKHKYKYKYKTTAQLKMYCDQFRGSVVAGGDLEAIIQTRVFTSGAYLIFVIFCTPPRFLACKLYAELRNVNSFTQSKILELNFTPRKARK